MRIWTRKVIGTFVCALSLGLTTQAYASPAQTIPGNVQAPYPNSDIGFQVNLREQGRITGSATVAIVDAHLLVDGVRTDRFPIGVSGTCVTVGRGADFPNRRFSLVVTIENGQGRDVGEFPLTNSPAPPIQDQSCSYLNTAPVANIAFSVEGNVVDFTGFGTDRENDRLTFAWYLDNELQRPFSVLQSPREVQIPVGQHLITLRVTDEAGLVGTATATLNIVAPVQTVNLGPDRRVTASGSEGAVVEIVPTITSNAQPVTYRWREGEQTLSFDPVFRETLGVGEHNIGLEVFFSNESTGFDDIVVIVDPPTNQNQRPTAAAGNDFSVPDNDGNVGERSVAVDGSGSSDPENSALTYSWRDAAGAEIGTGVRGPVRLINDGANDVTLVVTDAEGLASAPDTVRITVRAAQDIVAEAGPPIFTDDPDGVPGDNVTLTSVGSSGPGITYQWLLGENLLSREANPPPLRFDEDRVYDVTLVVTDRFQRSARDEVRVTVRARPVANAGTDRTVPSGEPVQLNGGESTDRDGQIVSYQWYDRLDNGAEQLLPLTGVQITPQLAPGSHTIRLRVTDNSGLLADDTVSIRVLPPPGALNANAGPDQTLTDEQGDGENVTLDGSQSTGPSEQELFYTWYENERVIAEGRNPSVRLDRGTHDIMLQVSYFVGSGEGQQEITDTDTVRIVINGVPLEADAGGDRTEPDSDRAPGELVTLDASSSRGPIRSYAWTVDGRSVGAGERILRDLPLTDGVHVVTITVRDGEASDTDEFRITVVAPPVTQQPPTANAGTDQNVSDTDGEAGELVSLSATASDPDGTIASYRWMVGETEIATGQTAQPRLPDGVTTVTLIVTDDSGLTATDTVQITVAAPLLPIVDPGISQTLEDTDVQAGEMVTLAGSATGNIARYEWFLGNTSLGVGQSIRVRLPDGVNLVTLRATNAVNRTGTATVRISVAVGVRTVLANVPGLTENEKRLAENLDAACNNILGPLTPVQTPTTPGETTLLTKGARPPTEQESSDFAQKCRGLLISRNNAQLKDAMGALLGDDFAAARTQTLLFANTQYASVMDRLIALRGGARGLSLAGLNIMVDGEMIPLASLQGLAKELLGGGASSDADGGLWSDKWGLWARGNYSFGSKKDDRLSPSFDADQYALLAGLDYRLTETAVIGGALAYGNSSVDFSGNDGSLDTESWALSLYGSLYAKRNFYFDAIVNVADAGYTAERNIAYVDGYGLVNADADGDTGGMTLSGGMSGGYDFLIGGLTISPTIGAFYIDAQIDEFTESGAGGLNLIYDEQQFKSLTGTLGVRMTFSWNLPFGVVLPHFRADFVREFEDDVDVFGIRFAADPNAPSAPPILIETENADTSYWRLAAGVSAQFKHGISGYVEYQRLESFQFISFQDVSVGLRFQAAF